MFYTYVLLSRKDKRFYVGFTNDLQRRLGEHHKGQVPATASRRPLDLVYYEACLNQNDAIDREKYLKAGYGRRFLRNRIKRYMDLEN